MTPETYSIVQMTEKNNALLLNLMRQQCDVMASGRTSGRNVYKFTMCV